MQRSFILILANLLCAASIFASHNRAGEIIYEQTDDLSIMASIITYTDANSLADRDSLLIDWGDGQTSYLLRINGPDLDGDNIPDGELLGEDYRINIYSGAHTFSSQGEYKIATTDANREENILNINFPNSGSIPFHLETTVFMTEEPNNSPVILSAPIDIAYVNSPFIYIPESFDEDDDSVAYRMITPLMGSGEEVTNFSLPSEINPGTNNSLHFNNTTGILLWTTPQMEGLYNIAIEVLSYRDGVLNGSVIRDMQILVKPEFNNLAMLDVEEEFVGTITEVEVGDTVNIEMTAMDNDLDQELEITALSGLFDFFSVPPTFIFSNINNNPIANFSWVVEAEHIRQYPINVVFKVSDNLGLASYVLTRFRVKGFVDGVKETPQPATIAVYPNPTVNYIYVKNLLASAGEYILYNNSGQLIQQGNYQNGQALDCRILPAGIYYLNIDRQFTFPFVKK